jgi:hypothetical protein
MPSRRASCPATSQVPSRPLPRLKTGAAPFIGGAKGVEAGHGAHLGEAQALGVTGLRVSYGFAFNQ